MTVYRRIPGAPRTGRLRPDPDPGREDVVNTLERVREEVRRVDSWRAVRPLLAASVRYCEARLVEKGFLPGQSQYRKFVVVTRARTGSNLLISLLNSHPQVDARGEMFREMKGQSVESRLDRVFRRRPRRIEAVGFKIFYYHPLDDHHSQVWDRLCSMDDLYILHLKRRNVLRTVTSRKLAGSTDIWLDKGRGGSTKEKPAVRFSAKDLGGSLRTERGVGSRLRRAIPQSRNDADLL